jgi:hypothetical protein
MGRIVLGTLLDDFLQIHAKIGDIILYGFADHILHPVQKKALFGATVEEKRELGGTGFIYKACILNKRLLGTSGVLKVPSKLRRSEFSRMEG